MPQYEFAAQGRILVPIPTPFPLPPSPTPTDGEATVAVAAALNANFGNANGGGVSLADFAAVGDGVTDNSGVIAEAIASFPSGGGGMILVPPGIFACKSPIIQPLDVSIRWVGCGRDNSIILYTGTTLQPFFTLEGGNQGSTFEHLMIAGGNCNPAVLILTTPGTPGYQANVFFCNCNIGFGGHAGTIGFPAAWKANIGAIISCDQLKSFGTHFEGHTVGLRLEQGTTDAYLFGDNYSADANATPPGYCFWCADDGLGNGSFNGTVNMFGCSINQGATAGFLLRSICNLYGCYCENSILPVFAHVCTLRIIGGKLSTTVAAAQYLVYANATHGVIRDVYFGCTNAVPLLNVIKTTFSPDEWDILQVHFVGSGIPTTGQLAIDTPNFIRFADYNQGYIASLNVPPSGGHITNTYQCDVRVYLDTVTNVSALTLTGMQINGQQVGVGNGPWLLRPKDTLSPTYTGATGTSLFQIFGA